MKIIFLDIDGVMATSNDYGVSQDNKWGAYRFDSKCVSVLNNILDVTGAEIVLSSDWKYHYTLLEMREIFEHNGVIKGPICFTPKHKTNAMNLEGGRVGEIKEWREHHDWKNTMKWVAIDDLNMSEDFAQASSDVGNQYRGGLSNFVHCTRHREGIKQSGLAEKIIKFLT